MRKHLWGFLFFWFWDLRVTQPAIWLISLFPTRRKKPNWNLFFTKHDKRCILQSYIYLAITKWLRREAIFLVFNKNSWGDVRARSDGITMPCTVQCTHSGPAVQCIVSALYIQPIENTASSRGVTRGLAPSIISIKLKCIKYLQNCRCCRAI